MLTNDAIYSSVFPYESTPQNGRNHLHDSPLRLRSFPGTGGSLFSAGSQTMLFTFMLLRAAFLLAVLCFCLEGFAAQAHDPGLSSAKLVLQNGLLRATLTFAARRTCCSDFQWRKEGRRQLDS